MDNSWKIFEHVARNAYRLSETIQHTQPLHPFELRDIHSSLPGTVRKLFDNGHYPQATFEAFKFIDKEIERLSGVNATGQKLMMAALDPNNSKIKLTSCQTQSEKDEQEGFRFLFAGSINAIRNPRGHEYHKTDSPDECLDHLSLASVLLRRLETAGYKITDASKIFA